MRIITVAAMVLAAVGLSAPPSGAQDLAAAAAKEKERRKAAQQKTKVYTEGDLGKGHVGDSAPNDAAQPAADAPAKEGAAPAGQAGKQEKTADELKAEQQKAWRDKMQQANDNVTQLSARVDQLQQSVNDISGLYAGARTSQLAELEQAQKQLADAKQAVADLEEQGRKNGYR